MKNKVLAILVCLFLARYTFANGLEEQEFFKAAVSGNPQRMQFLITQGADVNSRDPNGATALLWAARYGELSTVRLLVANGADPNVVGAIWLNEQRTVSVRDALVAAIYSNNYELVKFLVEECSVGVNHESLEKPLPLDYLKPLHAAILGSRFMIARYLVDNGADLNGKNSFGLTALDMGIRSGNISFVRFLLFSGATPQVKHSITDTSLMIAIEKGEMEIVQMLLEHGANPNELGNKSGLLPVVLASQLGRVSVLRQLKKHGAELEGTIKDGTNGLIAATIVECLECVRFLIENDANVNHVDANGFPAVFYAAQGGNLKITMELIESGADTGDGTAGEWSVLVAASISGNNDLVDYLLVQGAKPDHRLANGVTALIAATLAKNYECVRILLDCGANRELTAELGPLAGKTAQMIAEEKGYWKIYRLLEKSENSK